MRDVFRVRLAWPLGAMRAGVLALAPLLTSFLAAQDAQPIHIVAMAYVPKAREARIADVVRLNCLLNPDGSVAEVKVLLGHPILLKEVIANAREWRFSVPAKPSSGAMAAQLIYEFKLTNPVCDGPYKERFVFDQPDRITVTSEYPCFKPDR